MVAVWRAPGDPEQRSALEILKEAESAVALVIKPRRLRETGRELPFQGGAFVPPSNDRNRRARAVHDDLLPNAPLRRFRFATDSVAPVIYLCPRWIGGRHDTI